MMSPLSYYMILAVILVGYFVASKFLFDDVYYTLDTVIDELFHIPQGLKYCENNFSTWDSKITTFPGLYLISAAVGKFFLCNIYNLRFINLVASCVNLLLFSSLLNFIYVNGSNGLKTVLQALNLALLPPLYFFSHIYYTDTISLTFLLVFFRLCLTNKNKLLILIFGALSILMRQTNIVWVGMVFGHKLLDLVIRTSRVFGNKYVSGISLNKNSLIAKDIDKSKLKRYYSLSDIVSAFAYHVTTCARTFFRFLTVNDFLILSTHLLLLTSFVVFVVVNGSIVLGDKTAHQATLNLPQMLYFLIFYGVFGLFFVLSKFKSTVWLILRNKVKFLLISIVFLVIIHFNTVVHPYLLADNRHYTFYIWNRWYGKYEFARYATVPLYSFLYFSLYDNVKDHNCISFLLPFSVCALVVLCLQSMLEVRYFLVPYIILRLRFRQPPLKMVIFEFLWYLIINYLAFNVFFTKEVYWNDFEQAQRIIW